MQIRDLYNIRHRLSMKRQVTNTKLAYAVKKNLRLISAELKDTSEILQQAPENLKEYEKSRLALCEEHAKKDEAGKPVMTDNEYVFEDYDAFVAALKPLQDEYAEALAEREKEVVALLDTEVAIDLHKIQSDDLPEGMSEDDIDTIMDIIWED